MRRALAVLLGLGLVAPTWAALGPRYGGDLTVALEGPLPRLTPGAPASAAERLVLALVHEPLLGHGPEGFPSPALARGWASAAGGREWTLTLDPEARFHDGTPVRSEDAVRSLLRFLAGDSAAAMRLAAMLAPEGLTAPDAGHVVLRLNAPRPLPLLPLAAAPITSAQGSAAGPFVPTHELPGKRLALTAFGSHVRGRPYLDRVTIVARPHAEPETGLAPARPDMVLGEPGVSALAATLLLVLAADRPPFDRAQARGEVAAALTAQDSLARVLPAAEPATSLLVPGLLPPLDGTPRAPAGGAFAGAVSLVVSTEVPPFVSQRVVAQLDALGFRVIVRAMEPSLARSSAASARLLAFVPELPEAALALRELLALAPVSGVAAQALDAADAEIDLDRRRGWIYKAEAALREQASLIPLAVLPVSARVRAGLEGVRVDAGGRVLLEDAWTRP